jgi:hypothetical protein
MLLKSSEIFGDATLVSRVFSEVLKATINLKRTSGTTFVSEIAFNILTSDFYHHAVKPQLLRTICDPLLLAQDHFD